METEERQEWSTDDLQRLLRAIQENIPGVYKKSAYNQAQMRMDWSLVAFHPYTPEVCKNKWKQITQKMRKVRTLQDLVDEAQDTICNPSIKNCKVHPCLPKKPIPPNSIFFQEKQAKWKKKNPHLGFGEIMKMANKKYNKLPPEKKEKYIKKFKDSSQEYTEKMMQFRSQYKDANTQSDSPRKKSGKGQESGDEETTGPPKPVKPPPNAYTLFCKEQWATKEKGINNKNYIKVCAQRWKEMDEGTKTEYKQRFQKMKNEYQQDISAEGFRVKQSERSAMLAEMFPNEPKKPIQSGHVLFCREHMDLLKAELPEVTKRLSVVSPLWQALSSPDKTHYRNMAADGFMKYTVELKKWFEKLTPKKKTEYRKLKPQNCEIIDLDIEEMRKRHKKKDTRKAANENLNIPSDSEDEDMEYYSSSDDEDYDSSEDEDDDDEEEEDEDAVMFEGC